MFKVEINKDAKFRGIEEVKWISDADGSKRYMWKEVK